MSIFDNNPKYLRKIVKAIYQTKIMQAALSVRSSCAVSESVNFVNLSILP